MKSICCMIILQWNLMGLEALDLSEKNNIKKNKEHKLKENRTNKSGEKWIERSKKVWNSVLHLRTMRIRLNSSCCSTNQTNSHTGLSESNWTLPARLIICLQKYVWMSLPRPAFRAIEGKKDFLFFFSTVVEVYCMFPTHWAIVWFSFARRFHVPADWTSVAL